MIYTVSDFIASHGSQVKLVAGSGGLARPVEEVAILDYELVAGLKEKYRRNNFYEDQLVLSTFLYAKDDPYLIVEAIKYLVGKGTSGLVIKNVLRLPIPDAALRYAEARNFPLMVTTSDEAFFDVIVRDVNARIADLSSVDFCQHQLDAIWSAHDNLEEVKRLASGICPSFRKECVVALARLEDSLPPNMFDLVQKEWRRGPYGSPYSLATIYNGGLLAIVSGNGDDIHVPAPTELAAYMAGELLPESEVLQVGVSEVHYRLGELGIALHQAAEAAVVAARRGKKMECYERLGVYRVVLPFAASPQMADFANAVLGPLQEFDAENGSALGVTLMAWQRANQSVDATADALGQHPNTVRYRFEQIRQLTGLDRRVADEAQQLSLVAAIAEAQGILQELDIA